MRTDVVSEERSDAMSGQSRVSPESGHTMQSLTALILLGVSLDKTRALDPFDMDIGRAFTTIPDLSPFGVNLTSTFTSLLSPSGIVDQFSLSIVIQIIFVVGYVLSGKIFIYILHINHDFSSRFNFCRPKE